jgi:hypothetical protein
MKPRFGPGEVVRIASAPAHAAVVGEEAVVEEVAGPNEEGTGWLLTLRLPGVTGVDSMIVLAEDDVEPTGFAESPTGERVMMDPEDPGPIDFLELRLFTEIADGIEAAKVADAIEQEIPALLGDATITTEAERHWSQPYNYELEVSIGNLADPVEALQILAEAGGDGWLACRDDGWRVELFWSATRDPDAMLIVPEVHAAEVAFLPWSSPARRPDSERPLVSVDVPLETPEEPARPDDTAVEEPEPSDPEAGDEEP